MHIAICNDNGADRKHLERLLKRESDKREATTGTLYIDSYGHPENLLNNSMQYDVFFIDISHTEGLTGIDVVNSLTDLGNTAPIILSGSDFSYDNQNSELSDRILFIDKPFQAAQITTLLNKAQNIKDSSASAIELREDKGTLYVMESDILYAVEAGRNLIVTLKDGRKITLSTTAMNFFSQVENYPEFFSPNAHTLVNARHIANIRFHKITMCDGTMFKAFGQVLSYAKHIKEYITENIHENISDNNL